MQEGLPGRVVEAEFVEAVAALLLERSIALALPIALVKLPRLTLSSIESWLHGRGIGYLLMQRLIDAAKARGVVELFGDVLSENDVMLKMIRELGFALAPYAKEAGVVQATKQLRT